MIMTQFIMFFLPETKGVTTEIENKFGACIKRRSTSVISHDYDIEYMKGWLVPSEVFPMEIRSAGQSITVSVNMFFTFVIGQLFLTMLCDMKFGLFFFFGGFFMIMTQFIMFFLPETKGIPIEEVNRIWKNHWFWKKYMPVDDIHA
ncbi:hypothetical protein RND71_002375 [Anisodus tanguticus]|uniref:Major facilitator superfamily (MFS) profile domain-containing protein n=1 Tax=Anisodus tanguticus TaxID=243964 RepID=A0AAE1VRY0_9SOLA|nr:hypothetical protein RND71_002375 [Anisodus tanguticus]